MAEVINNVKEFIESYCRILHLQNMDAAVRKRYDSYAKTGSFAGNMKHWAPWIKAADKDEFPDMDDDNWKKLYNLFQEVFETMAAHQADFALKDGTKKFFENWFGPGKTFRNKQTLNSNVDSEITRFANFLDANKVKLQMVLTPKNYNTRLDDEFKLDTFISDIKAGKYLTDTTVRDRLISIASYTQQFSNSGEPAYWGAGVAAYSFSPSIPNDPNEWFVTRNLPTFKYRANELFNKLLTSPKIFEDFQKYDQKGIISGQINKAIEKTNYANTNSDDYVAPDYKDKKNLFERVNDKLDDIKRNNIDPWLTLRGTRRYFTDYAKTVIDACSKVKNKDGEPMHPADGLQGFLDNKDAIIDKINEKDPKGRRHFEWFVKKLDIYSKKTPRAFAGAFHNPYKLKKIVSMIITDACAEGKVDEAKTALETMSVMKYAMIDSKTVDALKKQEFNTLSDKGLSWNNYEIGRFVTGALDWGIKKATLGIGRGLAGIRNLWFRSNTKFKGKMGDIDKAHENWAKRNDVDKLDKNLEGINAELTKTQTNLDLKNTAIEDAGGEAAIEAKLHEYETKLQEKAALEREISDLQNAPAESSGLFDRFGNPITSESKIREKQAELRNIDTQIRGLGDIDSLKGLLAERDELEYNISAIEEQKAEIENKKGSFDKDHNNDYVKLMAFWDMLESYTKSHAFTFSADRMRKKFLDKDREDRHGNPKYKDADGNAISHAKHVESVFLEQYKNKYSNAA